MENLSVGNNTGFVYASGIRFTHYKLVHDREKSFVNWPTDTKQSPKELAEAGFYYKGYGDSVICFSCGLSLHQLEPNDNMWVEHKRFLERPCLYLELNHELLKRNEIQHKVALSAMNAGTKVSETVAFVANDQVASYNRFCCKVCFDNIANVILLPCRHQAICSQCVFGIDDHCPICRQIIDHKISAIIS